MSTTKGASNIVYLVASEESRRQAALARVVSEHEIPLLRFLRFRLANQSDREEVAQEVFLRLCRQVDFEDKIAYGAESTRAYLFTIATNLIRDRHRRAMVRKSDLHEHLDDETMHDNRASVEDQVHTSQKLDMAVEIIRRLPEKQARAFVMSRFKGMSYREISEQMGVSCSMVEKYISVALAEIRNKIGYRI